MNRRLVAAVLLLGMVSCSDGNGPTSNSLSVERVRANDFRATQPCRSVVVDERAAGQWEMEWVVKVPGPEQGCDGMEGAFAGIDTNNFCPGDSFGLLLEENTQECHFTGDWSSFTFRLEEVLSFGTCTMERRRVWRGSFRGDAFSGSYFVSRDLEPPGCDTEDLQCSGILFEITGRRIGDPDCDAPNRGPRLEPPRSSSESERQASPRLTGIR